LAVISPENAAHVEELARWGRGYTNQIAISPDGKQIAVASTIGIDIYDLQTLKSIQFIDTGEYIEALTYIPNANMIASISITPSPFDVLAVILWDIKTGELVYRFPKPIYPIESITCSSDGSKIAASSRSGSIIVWDITRRNISWTKEIITSGEGYSFSNVFFSPDGSLLALADGNSVEIYDASNGTLLNSMEQKSHGGWKLAFSPDGQSIAIGERHGIIELWDVNTWSSQGQLEGIQEAIESVSYNSTGNLLTSVSYDGLVNIWDIKNKQLLRTIFTPTMHTMYVAFSPKGDQLVVGSTNFIKVWDVISGELLKSLYFEQSSTNFLNFSPDGTFLTSTTGNGIVQLRRIQDGKVLQTFNSNIEFVRSESFSPDGKIFAIGSDNGMINLWNAKSGILLLSFDFPNSSIDDISFSSNGRILAATTGKSKRGITLWNQEIGREWIDSPFKPDVYFVVSFSSDGNRLFAASHDGQMSVWDLQNDVLVSSFSGHSEIFETAVFSPDGSRVIAGYYDGFIEIWDAINGNILYSFKGHTDIISGIAFSPDGTIFASASWDEEIKLWNTDNGKQLTILSNHTSAIDSLAFSPDGRILASGSWDGTVRLWGVP
jgi:WD40 repeat protein